MKKVSVTHQLLTKLIRLLLIPHSTQINQDMIHLASYNAKKYILKVSMFSGTSNKGSIGNIKE